MTCGSGGDGWHPKVMPIHTNLWEEKSKREEENEGRKNAKQKTLGTLIEEEIITLMICERSQEVPQGRCAQENL